MWEEYRIAGQRCDKIPPPIMSYAHIHGTVKPSHCIPVWKFIPWSSTYNHVQIFLLRWFVRCDVSYAFIKCTKLEHQIQISLVVDTFCDTICILSTISKNYQYKNPPRKAWTKLSELSIKQKSVLIVYCYYLLLSLLLFVRCVFVINGWCSGTL